MITNKSIEQFKLIPFEIYLVLKRKLLEMNKMKSFKQKGDKILKI